MGHHAWCPGVNNLVKCDVVVVQKRFDFSQEIAFYKAQGIPVVFDCDDLMENIPFNGVDVVTTDTPYKKEYWRKPNVIVVPDALDLDADSPKKSTHADVLQRVVWCGNPENVYHIANAAEACQHLDLEFTAITDLGKTGSWACDRNVQGIQWDVDSVDEELIQHDLFVAPFLFDGQWGEEWVKSKSANKVLKAWGLGLPVIGCPIPAYEDAGVKYLAYTVEEWVTAFTALMECTAREQDAERGYTIAQQYRAERVAPQWLDVFKGVVHDEQITSGQR